MDAVNDINRTKRVEGVRSEWRETKYKPTDLEERWDWICSNIGFDERGMEIQKAIREFVKLKIKENER